MKTPGNGKNNRRIHIEKPAAVSPEDDRLWQQARHYAQLIPSEPEPNMGRVDEIKEEIKKGTYLTSEAIEETAARLTLRFMRKE
ncbi:MAG: flagellar biosynthesis anti-sigma factor FlgM [Candidatus Omnitrophica bacterium]|nr:flagellar biosynthesis anti-sigma factor FlgM [Candidatus Omnitrophota bacterium]